MHFYIDHTKITTQVNTGNTPDMKFGPDATNSTTIFNVTTQHQLTSNAKAFACQEGMLVVQRNDDDTANLVNVIIKPSEPTKVDGVAVRYYVYRGMRLASFFTVNAGVHSIIPDGTTGNSEFLSYFWVNYNEHHSEDASCPTPTALNLGYGADTLPLSDPNNLNENRSIDDIFNNKTPAKAVHVKEGTWIGDFSSSSKIGFDIVLESDLVIPSELKLFRASTRSIDTGSLVDLALRRKKEEILAFMDPAAFFGLHYQDKVTGVDTTTYTGTTKNASVNRTIPGSLYTEIIGKYTNKNNVYVDIRSERGMSYNFYETYKISSGTPGNPKNIRLNGADEAGAAVYGTNGWPLHIVTSANNVSSSRKNSFSIRLRRDGNTEPVLFLLDKNYSYQNNTNKDERKHFFEGDSIKENGVNDWTEDLTIYYPNDNSASDNNLATHIKMFYYLNAPVTSGTERIYATKYYDAAFCPIDLAGLGDTAVDNGWVESPTPNFVKEALQTDGTGNFALTSRSGAYWDDSKVLFYSASLDKKINNSGKSYLSTFTKKLSLSNTKFNSLKNQFEVINRQYQRDIGGTNTDFNILGINDYSVGRNHKEKEDLLLLGITPTELQTIKGVSGLSDHHPKYIYLVPEASNPQYDTTTQHHRYHKYTIHIQGMRTTVNPDGDSHRVATSVSVFSRDNVFFSSNDFAALESLSDGANGLTVSQQNRIEFHIYHNGIIKINDNIDLALLRKSTIVDEHTVTADTAITGDQSNAQQVHFLWYPELANGVCVPDPTLITSFNIVMANRMKRLKEKSANITITIPDYSLTISYTSGDYRQSYTSGTSGDIISTKAVSGTGGTKMKYINQKKKVFLVHFVTALTSTDTNRKKVFDSTNNTLGLVFSYGNTKRRYVDLPLCAAILGAMIRNGRSITSNGFSFGDASSAPSGEHVNGTALDSNYFKLPATTWQQDVDFIAQLNHFGVTTFRTGQNTNELNDNLDDEPFINKVLVDTDAFIVNSSTGKTLHDTHLHSAYVKLNED